MNESVLSEVVNYQYVFVDMFDKIDFDMLCKIKNFLAMSGYWNDMCTVCKNENSVSWKVVRVDFADYVGRFTELNDLVRKIAGSIEGYTWDSWGVMCQEDRFRPVSIWIRLNKNEENEKMVE